MVPHVKVEDAINAILGDSASAVTAVPDASKGERLVAFYTRQDVDSRDALGAAVPDRPAEALDSEARKRLSRLTRFRRSARARWTCGV